MLMVATYSLGRHTDQLTDWDCTNMRSKIMSVIRWGKDGKSCYNFGSEIPPLGQKWLIKLRPNFALNL